MSHRHKVAITMSGGLDSAVAVALLQRQGWNLEGVYLRLSPLASSEDLAGALAQRLGIPLNIMTRLAV